MIKTTTTITACSTALPGAIGIIRLSGPRSGELLDKVFISKTAKNARKIRLGEIRAGKINDGAMAIFFQAPASYTGEDMAEIYIHGSTAVAAALLRVLIENGAQPAMQGEFTKRAFLNGKMDLSSAEGVINLINSESEKEAVAAYALVSGKLGEKIKSIQQKIKAATAQAEAAIDYPEEGIEDQTAESLLEQLNQIQNELSNLKESYQSGRLIKNGIKGVVTGEVNVGKSQLVNALLQKDRAIVTASAGTTRDTLEDSYEYKGYKFIITDTAGIRETKNEIEKLGIQRAIEAAAHSDIIIVVTEAGKGLSPQLKQLYDPAKATQNIIYVENKIDKYMATENDTVKVSALKEINIEQLKEEILTRSQIRGNKDIMLTEVRHFESVSKAEAAIENAIQGLGIVTMDCIAADMTAAYNFLGQITGHIGSAEIIDEIFARFCVGK